MFKVPVAPPHKTPEVVVLEEFPCHVTGRKSCSIPLSSSGDMDQSVDLFGNMDDQLSPGIHLIHFSINLLAGSASRSSETADTVKK